MFQKFDFSSTLFFFPPNNLVHKRNFKSMRDCKCHLLVKTIFISCKVVIYLFLSLSITTRNFSDVTIWYFRNHKIYICTNMKLFKSPIILFRINSHSLSLFFSFFFSSWGGVMSITQNHTYLNNIHLCNRKALSSFYLLIQKLFWKKKYLIIILNWLYS